MPVIKVHQGTKEKLSFVLCNQSRGVWFYSNSKKTKEWNIF